MKALRCLTPRPAQLLMPDRWQHAGYSRHMENGEAKLVQLLKVEVAMLADPDKAPPVVALVRADDLAHVRAALLELIAADAALNAAQESHDGTPQGALRIANATTRRARILTTLTRAF